MTTSPPLLEEPADPALSPETGKPITRTRMLRFGLGFLAFGLTWGAGLLIVSNVLLPQRLTDIGVSSPEALLGTINSITALVSLVTNLVAGNLSDRTRSRFGRRSPWVLAGAVIGGASLFGVGAFSNAALLTISYCLAMVGLNMMLAPAIAVLSDRIPESMRGTLSSFYGIGNTVGYPLGTMIGSRFLENTLPGFVLAGVLMFLGGAFALLIWPRERSATAIPRGDEGTLLDLVTSFRPPRHAPDFYKAFIGRLFMLLSYQMIYAYQLYILQRHIGLDNRDAANAIATMSIITLVVSIVAGVISGPLSDLIHRRKVPVVVASVLFGIGIAFPWVMPTTTGMFLFAGIAGFGYGFYTAVDQALNVDVLPNKEEAGRDLGILNLGTTLGQMVGPLVTSAIVVASGAYTLVFPVAIAAAVLGAVSIVSIKGVK